MVRVPVKLVTWDEIVNWSWELARKIKKSGFKPDIVIAVARGGYVPARLVCDFLGVENLISIQSQHWTEAAKKAERAIIKFEYVVDLSGMKALLVDDIADTGESLILARDFILSKWKPKELKVATLQWISPISKIKPDYYVMEVKDWIWFAYPWTRLEDITQFMRRMLLEEGKVKKEWSYSDIINKFIEWYGIDAGERYFNGAIKNLIDEGLLKRVDKDRYVLMK